MDLTAICLSYFSIFLTFTQNETAQALFQILLASKINLESPRFIRPKRGAGNGVDMNNPLNDSLLSIKFDPNITRQIDG